MPEDKLVGVPPDKGCFLHPKCGSCPEPICIFEFPGGPRAYLRQKELKEVLLSKGADLVEIAKELGIRKRTAERLYNRTSGR